MRAVPLRRGGGGGGLRFGDFMLPTLLVESYDDGPGRVWIFKRDVLGPLTASPLQFCHIDGRNMFAGYGRFSDGPGY